MDFSRVAAKRLKDLATSFPVVVVSGPRQSGKTTLIRQVYPKRPYVSLEELDVRLRVKSDPRGFLSQFPKGLLIDEAQHVPELLNYLQSMVDRDRTAGKYILTGSQNLLLSSQVTQSLAGRAAFLDLLPLTYAESRTKSSALSLDELMIQGAYPEVLSQGKNAADWFEAYVRTYLERDVRQITQVADLSQFQRFLRMMASRCGQMLNLNSVANDLGVAQTTVKSWLSVLEASYIAFRLPPYYVNYGKRIVKASKLYFYDVGLACWLLGIHDAVTMNAHPMRGALFENLMLLQYLKFCRNTGRQDQLFFWRDNNGNEVDLLVERSNTLSPVEFKSGATYQASWEKALRVWMGYAGASRVSAGLLISDAPFNGWSGDVYSANWRDACMTLE
jgi:uncharacterized protein